MLEKKIEVLSGYFDGILPLKDGYMSVRIIIPKSWHTFEKKIGDLSIVPVIENNQTENGSIRVNLVGEPGIDLGEIMDFAQHLILNNVEKESKISLFNQKVNDLKTIFDECTLSKLERLTFKFEPVKNKIKKNIDEKTEKI